MKTREYGLKSLINERTKDIERRPNEPRIYYERANAFLALENIDAAFDDYTSSIGVDSNYAPGYNGRGDIFLQRKNADLAFKEYFSAISADPRYAPSYVGRGNVYLSMNDEKSAFKEFFTAIKIDPQYAPGYLGRGDVYQLMEDKDAALQEYRRSLQLNPNYGLAYARIGNLYYYNFNNREAAVYEYERAVELLQHSGETVLYQETAAILDELNSHFIHKVVRGDSLSKLERRYSVPLSVIVSANRETYPSLVRNPDALEVGWRLKIPQ